MTSQLTFLGLVGIDTVDQLVSTNNNLERRVKLNTVSAKESRLYNLKAMI